MYTYRAASRIVVGSPAPARYTNVNISIIIIYSYGVVGVEKNSRRRLTRPEKVFGSRRRRRHTRGRVSM